MKQILFALACFLIIENASAEFPTFPGRDGRLWIPPKAFYGMRYDQIQWTLSRLGFRLATRNEIEGLVGFQSDDPEPGLAYLAQNNAVDFCTQGSETFYIAAGVYDDETATPSLDKASRAGIARLGEVFQVNFSPNAAHTIPPAIPNTGNVLPQPCLGAWAIQGEPTLCPSSSPLDFDCDGKDEKINFRDGSKWFIHRSRIGDLLVEHFGSTGDIPLVGDYTGDAIPDLALYRPSTGTWYIKNLVTEEITARAWGLRNDRPVAADFDGDGIRDLVVFRPSEGMYYGRSFRDVNWSVEVHRWGLPGDVVPNATGR